MHGIARARGQLFHHFHGTYRASIGLVFDSPEHAAAALRALGEPWKQGAKNPAVLCCSVDSDGVAAQKRLLGMYGADMRAIDSLRRSVDAGEPFSVDVPILPPAARPDGWRESFEDVSGGMVQADLFGGA